MLIAVVVVVIFRILVVYSILSGMGIHSSAKSAWGVHMLERG